MEQQRPAQAVRNEISETVEQLRIAENGSSATSKAALLEKLNRLSAEMALQPPNIDDLRLETQSVLQSIRAVDDCRLQVVGLNSRLNRLRDELVRAEAADREAAQQVIAKRYSDAMAAHRQDVYNALRSYRRLLAARKAAGATSTPPAFDSSLIRPMGWQGSVSEMVLQGTTFPHEADDREEVA